MRRASAALMKRRSLNTPVADPNRPLEILRTIHSFDPCIACAVHVIDAQGREYTIPRSLKALRKESPWHPREQCSPGIDHHPRLRVGPAIAVYVWQYPLRLVHWGLVICIGVLSFTGYYIHNPFIVGQTDTKFLMGWFRFVHESFGMVFIALVPAALLPVLRGRPLGALAEPWFRCAKSNGRK